MPDVRVRELVSQPLSEKEPKDLSFGNRWISDEREQYCTESILQSCANHESPNGT